MHSPTNPRGPEAGPCSAQGRPAPHEEPEFNNERDIPTESGEAGVANGGSEAAEESVAGEEDPGAALDELAGQG